MKKFISALSSLVIAATAMGGTLAITSNAASTQAVDTTIIEFRARSNNERKVSAKPGDTVTVDVYVPQSSGLNVISGALCINQNETLGQEGCKITNPATGEVVTKLPTARGNYGITMSNADFANPGCFDSGYCKLTGKNAGNMSTENNGFNGFYTDVWNLLYTADMAINRSAGSLNIDAYAPFVKAGGDNTKKKAWYNDNNYQPVFTWDENVEWAYDYKFMSFDLTLPDNIPNGSYEVNFLDPKTEYVTATSLFKTENQQTANTQVLGTAEDGSSYECKLETRGLVIQVGPEDVTTTTTTSATDPTTTTTTTTISSTPITTTTVSSTTVSSEDTPGNKIIYDLVPDDSSLKFENGKLYVDKGEAFTLNWNVKNDLGTAGMQFALDFSAFVNAGGKKDDFGEGDYNGTYQPGEIDADGRFELIYAAQKEQKVDDGGLVAYFDLVAPETEGEYKIDLWTKDGAVNQTVSIDDTKPAWPMQFNGITIVVGDVKPDTTTSTTATTTTVSTTSTTVTTTTSSTVSTTSTSSTVSTTTTTMTTPPDGEIFWGDVNCDKKVSVADVVLLNRNIAGTANVTAQGKKNADVVNDGTLDANDAKLIKQYIAEKVEYSALGKK